MIILLVCTQQLLGAYGVLFLLINRPFGLSSFEKLDLEANWGVLVMWTVTCFIICKIFVVTTASASY
ncbi:hypothetical protein V5799_018745 [Amblyomma americanum]|uniref:Uncharacterized protein n=1 Tax=Amblyomma americanum TaxID=6943 RepID=A0AAQ4EYW7_AMBAM